MYMQQADSVKHCLLIEKAALEMLHTLHFYFLEFLFKILYNTDRKGAEWQVSKFLTTGNDDQITSRQFCKLCSCEHKKSEYSIKEIILAQQTYTKLWPLNSDIKALLRYWLIKQN